MDKQTQSTQGHWGYAEGQDGKWVRNTEGNVDRDRFRKKPLNQNKTKKQQKSVSLTGFSFTYSSVSIITPM